MIDGHALSLPPDVSAARVALMRKAFTAMMQAPALRAEAEKSKMDIGPMNGDSLAQSIDGMFKVDAAAITRTKALFPQQ